LRFSSKEVHANSGLYYYGLRYYEPNLQRFINQDPIGEEGGINLYGFVYNSPINFVDPDGLTGWTLNNPARWGKPNAPDLDPKNPGPTTQDLEVLGMMAGMLLEPIDWFMTGKEIYDDPTNPWSYAGLAPFVPSAAGKAGKKMCELTKLGYKGGKKWRDAMKLIQKGGDVDLRKLGFTPTKAEALDMLREAGIEMKPPMFRIELPHGPPSTHTYPHINYPVPGGGKGTIRIQ